MGRCDQAGLFEGRNDFTTREMVERYVRPTAKAAGCCLLDVPTFPQAQVREVLRMRRNCTCSPYHEQRVSPAVRCEIRHLSWRRCRVGAVRN